jgi:hypothetical protein
MVRANGTQQRVPFCIGGVLDRRSPGKLALATRLARRDNLANQLIKTLVHDPEKKPAPHLVRGGPPFSEKIMHNQ